MRGSFLAGFRSRTERLLQISSENKPEVYLAVFESSRIASLSYWLELFLSAGIATLGLVLNSPAVVIGAMLISPLMGPILAAGLALATGDLYLGIRAVVAQIASMLGAVAISSVLVYWLPFHVATGEILARTRPNLLDLGVALLSGLAGSLFVARGRSAGGTTALPGVAIAVALMPPLCTVGFGVGTGWEYSIISGAGLLFLTNLAAIIASAFLVFLVVRMDGPDVRVRTDALILEEADRDPLFRLVANTRLARGFGDIGKLHWRVFMLAAVLAALYFPLKKGLVQVRDETVARAAIGQAVRLVSQSAAIVSQQVDLPPSGPIRVQLISAEEVPGAKVAEAERLILRKTGREVHLQVRQVANQEELARLQANLSEPAPPPVRDLESIRAELVSRLEAPLKELWPSSTAKLIRYELAFSPQGIVVLAEYEAPQPLAPETLEVVKNALRARLAVPNLEFVAREQLPAPHDLRGQKKAKQSRPGPR